MGARRGHGVLQGVWMTIGGCDGTACPASSGRGVAGPSRAAGQQNRGSGGRSGAATTASRDSRRRPTRRASAVNPLCPAGDSPAPVSSGGSRSRSPKGPAPVRTRWSRLRSQSRCSPPRSGTYHMGLWTWPIGRHTPGVPPGRVEGARVGDRDGETGRAGAARSGPRGSRRAAAGGEQVTRTGRVPRMKPDDLLGHPPLVVVVVPRGSRGRPPCCSREVVQGVQAVELDPAGVDEGRTRRRPYRGRRSPQRGRPRWERRRPGGPVAVDDRQGPGPGPG